MIAIREVVYDAIRQAFTATEHPPECGGVLGTCDGQEIVAFYFDATGTSTKESYIPDVEAINRVLKERWAPAGLRMVGMIHSHGNAGGFPSCGDLYYCEQIMRCAEIEEFLLPIVTLDPFELHMYRVLYRDQKIKAELIRFELIP